MKLTLAMGLQYDNGKSNNLYALSIGGERQKPMTVQKNSMPGGVHTSNQRPALLHAPQAALFLLTYNLKGDPVPFIQNAANINLFA